MDIRNLSFSRKIQQEHAQPRTVSRRGLISRPCTWDFNLEIKISRNKERNERETQSGNARIVDAFADADAALYG